MLPATSVKKRPPTHPPEPRYPCYVSVLGELAELAPREGRHKSTGSAQGLFQLDGSQYFVMAMLRTGTTLGHRAFTEFVNLDLPTSTKGGTNLLN